MDGPWTVRRLLEWTSPFLTRKSIDAPRLSAELLLAHVLKIPRIGLYTDYDRRLTDPELTRYRDLVRRAAEHEPVAYLTGIAHFFNLEFEVSPDVLIPRPDTEVLVEQTIQLLRAQVGLEAPRILDLCTGSACIAAAVAHNVKTAVVTATDISPAAVAVARRNLQRLGLDQRVIVETGDLYEPLNRMIDRAPFDFLLSNPPYIPSGQIESLDPNVRDYEPRSALDGGLDGLDFHRRILAGAPQRLNPAGHLFLEIAFDQGPAALNLATQIPALEHPRIIKDYAGRDRVLTARKKA